MLLKKMSSTKITICAVKKHLFMVLCHVQLLEAWIWHWHSVQDFTHVDVGVLAHHLGAHERIADGDPLRPVPHRWHRDTFHPHRAWQQAFLPGNGTQEGYWTPRLLPLTQEKGSSACSACARTTMVFVCKRRQGKTEFLQALLVLHTQYHMVGKFVNDQFNAGGSAILVRKTVVHGDTMRTHVIAQMGQDHFVEIRSENRLLMIADVHLEPGSSLGNL